ncbi:MAG TPA: sigma 54-interacting transcriptional regulator [Firmicutes bacterium]|nr:sigma 54-interacting transcriptional regulator [Candidatus Fermentithermobacillaceae bacterium]
MIGVLAPYREIVKTVVELQKDIPEPIEVVLTRVTDAVAVAKKLIRSGALVLVARGGTANTLKSEVLDGTPVVEIPITGYDLLRAIAQARKRATRICVMAYQNMIEGLDKSILGLLGDNIEVVPLTATTDVCSAIKAAAATGDVCFVGGAITCELADSMRYPSVLIRSGKEGISYALREAARIVEVQKLEAEKRYRLRAVLDSMEDGIIVTDSEGVPEFWNTKAAKLLQAENIYDGRRFPLLLLKDGVMKCIKGESSDDSVIKLPTGAQVVASFNLVEADRRARGVLVTLRDAVRVEAMEHKVRSDVHFLGFVAKKKFSDIIGKSSILRKTVSMAEAFAQVDATVLITGESGTGKEVYAQAIHNASARRNGPYVAVNCAALPESLLESELFGYAGGAFTGASRQGRPGLFELAHKGTILLDEISELPKSLQGKLLRVLQERQVRRVGGDRIIPVDVRVIAATNKDLVAMVEQGQFREDLFYRLDVLRLTIPPLRSRPEDIVPLFKYFVAEFARDMGLSQVKLSEDAISFLEAYPWPGNIRQVQNVVQRCLALYAGETVTSEKLERVLVPGQAIPGRAGACLAHSQESRGEKSAGYGSKDLTIDDIKRALNSCGGSVSKAARLLGIHRTTLWRRLKKSHTEKD